MNARPHPRLPLTGAQTGVWYGQRLAPDSPAYNVGQYVEIRGQVDRALFERALRRTVAETEVLGMAFGERDGTPYQERTGPGDWELGATDLRAEPDPDAAALALMHADMHRPADPAADGGLFAFALHTVADDRVLWYQRVHHIALDAYGFALFTRRVAEVYTALRRGTEPGPTPFGAIGAVLDEEAAYRDSPQYDKDRAHWRERLADRPEVATLSGGSRPAAPVFLRRGATLDTGPTAALLALAERTRATWAELATAAFAAYLHRMTGSRKVLLALPAMSRLGSAALRVPVMTVNVLPLRVPVRPDTTLADLAGSCVRAVRDLRRHQRYRAEDIRRDLHAVGLGRGPLGPMVNIKAFDDQLDFDGAPGAPHNIAAGPVDDLTLSLYLDGGTRLRFELDANPSAYPADELDRRCAEFARLLESVAGAAPETPVGRLDLLPATEPAAWSANDRVGDGRSVVELFAERAVAVPDASAVVAGGVRLSYGELDARVGALAAVLRARGVGAESFVGLALPRTAELVVGMLAVLRSGAAYLPLDLDYPAERLAFMVEDARPVCVLTLAATAHLVPAGAPVLVLDGPETVAELAAAVPVVAAPVDPASPAYVIHTSGSTGKPKGVVVPHGALADFLAAMRADLDLGPGDGLVAVTTVSFDIAGLEIHGPLTTGAAVVLADRDTVRDPQALGALIDRHRPKVVQATPTLWHLLLADGSCSALAGVHALVGGEALPAELAERLARATRRTTNVYGPTEATVWATSAELDRTHTGVPVIGLPFATTRAHVLDGALRPVPVGVPGELYLAGRQVVRGYLGRPGLTAERFTADPFGPPGSRMYRTGDLVRRDRSGVLHFLSRVDDQVKLRGFRIELGEVEAALTAQPGVTRAVALVREDVPGLPQLVGYVTGTAEPGALRAGAAAVLPEYMVPGVILVLDDFPLTANGKIDRRALPAPGRTAEVTGRAPAGPVESALAEIFAEALGLPSVGAEQDFFALGGHSLPAARVVSRARSVLAAEVTIRDVFEAPTVAALAARLAGRRSAAARPEPVPLVPLARPEPLPLSYAQRGLWFLQQVEGPSATYTIPFVAHLEGSPDPDALRTAAADVVARHESLRTLFGAHDGEPYQRVLTPAEAADTVTVREVPADGLADAVAEVLARPFDVADHLPLRVALLRAPGGRSSALVLALHHIAGDEASRGPLLADLQRAYAARLAGHAPAWEPLPVQYADFALRQAGLDGARDLAYWRTALAGLPEEVPLPVDRPHPARPSGRGGLVELRLPTELASGVRALAREAGVSVFMVAHAAVAALLHRHGAGDDVPLGSPVGGRGGERALDGLVGFFVNTLVLRADLSGDPAFSELLARVRAVDLAALEHAEAPFGRVVEAVNPARSLGRHPLFQTMVSHNTVTQDTSVLFGCPARTEPVDPGTARFDLEFTFADTAGREELGLRVFYSSDVFDRATAEDLGHRLISLLAQVTADPALRVSRLDLLDETLRGQLIEWNANDRVGDGRSVVELFAERAVAVPDASAVVAGGVRLSYGELDARVGALAAVLRARGVGAESFVGLALPRTAELVVGMLAVLRSGAAYLPLDLDYPAERLAFMVEDARPVCVLTLAATAHLVPAGAPVLVLDDPATATELADAAPALPGPVDPGSPAYVIHTSGSTGKPKGVVVPHGALACFLETMRGELDLGPGDGLVAVTTVSFDIAALEIHVPLISGATVVLADRDTVREPRALAALIDRHRPKVVQATPTLWHALLAERAPAALAGVHALVGGEALPAEPAERLARATRRTTNVYGPTEVTVWATGAELGAGHLGTPAIGRPFPETRAYVLDGTLRPVAPGVPGELYLAGRQVVRGYLGRPGLTAERFTADPYGPPGSRMYRTGDLVRRDRSGVLHFLSRVDDQVKLRGFRIELGEVERALTAQRGVTRAVVLVREDVPGRRQLVGYVTGTAEPAALRTGVAAVLPEYMVPAVVVALDAIPLTANGKIDRRALPAPEQPAGTTGRAPAGPAETAVAEVFAEVLGAAEVGADDGFFALGGHSLLAARVAGRLRTALGAEVTVRDVFEAPTVAGLALRLARRGAGGAGTRPALVAGPRPEPLPLSANQRSLWFLHQLEGPGAAYNLPVALRVRGGGLEAAALRAAVADVVARHESLRTVFGERDGEPYQRVLTPAEAEVPFAVAEVAEDRLTAEAVEASRYAFDLATEVPLRVTLLNAPDGDQLLLLLLHHIAGDEWSTAPLLADLQQAYAGRLDGRAPQWEELPVQYPDFALWQAELPVDGQLEHWRTALAGLPEEIALPADRPRPAAADRRGGEVEFTVPAEVAAAMAELAHERGSSLFMLVHAAVAALLHRHGAGDDIPLGTPVAGRAGEAALDGLVGFFVNTLVLRTDLSGRPSFAELLDRVRTVDLAALEHADAPFDRVVEALNPARSPLRHPLFQTMVAFEADGPDTRRVFGLETAELVVDPGTAKFDLDVLLRRIPGRTELAGGIRYAEALFDRATVTALGERLVRLLRRVTADPHRPIAELDLLSAEEHDRLAAWNDTARSVPGGSIAELFAAQAARTPGATALVCGEERLSFAELDVRTEALARLLADRGVGPDRVVALALPRSAEAVVATLAVLRAGGAFLPLDLDHPAERLAYMLADAAPHCLLTTTATEALLPAAGDGPARIVLDAPAVRTALAEGREGPVRVATDPRHAAYVIYTSGSTGRPKGVLLDQGGLTNLFHDHDRTLYRPVAERLGRRVRALHTASFSFDSSWEQLLWLVAGHELHVLDETDRRDAEAVVAYCAGHAVDALDVTPSYAQQLLACGLLEPQARPRVLLLGGEGVPPALWQTLAGHPEVEVVNYYGPTEFTVDALVARIGDAATPVVGRSLDNTRAHVLDAGLRPVPVGVAGELYLAGEQLARGYLGRPGLTAERFTADPYGPPGTRMYRTGDLARRRADGLLEYLGRTDDQVKLRGFRIELGEVEAALTRRPLVDAAVAAVREDTPGLPRLVAYVTGDADPALLRRALAAELPEHLVPSAVVVLDTLPTTVNGKLDRAALPAPGPLAAEGGRAPRDAREELLCGVYAQLLGLAAVGADQDFFALGGHSLLATRLAGRIRAVLGVAVAVRDVFEAPTVAALAARLADRTGNDRPPLAPAAVRPDPLPLSAAQRMVWLQHQVQDTGAAYHIPLAVRLRGELDAEALGAALTDVVDRHEALRTVYGERDGEPCQRVLPAGASGVRLTVADCAEGELDAAARAVLAPAFDLAAEAPLRAALLRVGPQDHLLVIALHHIAGDEASTGPLLADLDRGYAARLAGHAPEWEELPVQYPDFALWQAELPVDGQREHWRAALAALPEEIALPADRPRPALPGHRGAVAHFELPAATAEALAALAREHGATVFMTVHAAVAALLHRLGAGEDIVVGTPVSGRGEEQLDGLVGFFLNTLVLRTDLSGTPGFAELLGRVRAADLAAFDHADLPFQQVVEAVAPARSAARHPLFQTMVTFHSAPASPARLLGLPAEEVELDAGGAKFDLEFAFGAAPDGSGRLLGGVRYALDRFEPATARALADRLVRLIGAAVAEPDRPLAELDLLSAEEQDRLTAWNDTAHPVPPGTLADLVAEGAARATGPALLLDDHALTRPAFEERVNRLARLLIGRGVGPESVVAVALPRSADLLVAVHAVVRAGGAYLPLDLDHPAERLAYLVETARPVCLLTDRAGAERLPTAATAPRLVLDSAEAELAGLSAESVTDADRIAPLRPGHPAYVIFTSGSTGRPKGVQVSHGAIVNRLRWMQHAHWLTAGDRVLHKTPAGFDVSVWELFWPLAEGVPLVVARPDGHQDPHYLAGLIRRQAVTVLHFVPSMLRAFLAEERIADCPGLRLVVCSGEALPVELAERFTASAAGLPVALENLYGPTEAAVDVTYERYRPGPAGGSVPIGRPVWNTAVRVLDAGLRPVPVGVAGELYLAGEQLARGYLGRPGLTAERFTADPYGPPGTRMYRTGDLARWLPDGRLDYLGRADGQVKLRGLRIELGEIEAVLASAPGVAQAAATVREDVPGRPRLVGYVVAARGAAPDPAELRRLAGEQLPAYMVPAVVVALDGLPLSVNGKLDRRALPAPAGAAPRPAAPADPVTVRGTTAAPPVAPADRAAPTASPAPADREPGGPARAGAAAAPSVIGGPGGQVPSAGPQPALSADPVALIAALMAEAIGLPAVPPDGNFFELGGDSIVSIRLVSLARRAGITLTARQVFQHATPAALAAAAELGPLPATGTAAAPPDDGVGDLPLPPIAHWFAERGGPVDRFAQARLLRLPPGARYAELVTALQAVLDRHAGLRQRLTIARPGVWSAETGPVGALTAADCLRTVDVAGLPADALREAVTVESDAATARLRPTEGRTVQGVHFDLGPGEPGRLLLVAHHLVVDEVSWQILLGDLRAAWEAVARGAAPALEPVGTSLRAWTAHLLAEAHTARRTAEAAHWPEVTRGAGRPLGSRPLDPAVDTAATAREVRVALSAERTAPLLDAVPAAVHGSVNDVLLTALALAAARVCGQRALTVELEGHGREQDHLPGADLSRTVGWLTSLYPVRLDPGPVAPGAAGGADAGAALKAVKEQLRAVPDGGLGAGLLRHANAATARLFDPDGTPEILWNYLGRTAAAPDTDWGPAPEVDALAVGPEPDAPLSHPLEVVARVEPGPGGPRLTARWIVAAAALPSATVTALTDAWTDALDGLAAWARGGDGGGHTPSDLDLIDLDQDQIAMLEQMWKAQQ
ncbi:amino acid adenylation domain-containing protein [Kitasatospora sp. NPDC096147]|uniref:amino acid adenylation domain-containing protein n=1 Tax=Kitasatospora sp. NPDC096147 TaxID=3364093 RepID=UPI0038228474